MNNGLDDLVKKILIALLIIVLFPFWLTIELAKRQK